MSRVHRWGVVGLLACAPASAAASNNIHDRTEVVWDANGTCGVVVVRSEDPVLTLAYTLPDIDDDGMLTTCDDDPSPGSCDYGGEAAPNPAPGADEVEDSRRHQFFASCRQRALDDPLPNWIGGPDLDAASAVETCCVPNECAAGMCPLVDPETVDEGDRLDASPDWSCCTHAISDRRPITVEQAAKGLSWDTSDVPEGVYAIDGYTWEPPYNLWSRRPGFVKVIDEAGSADRFPAAAIMHVEDDGGGGGAIDGIIDGCETVHITGCVDAGAGATLQVWWKESRPDRREWHRVLRDVAVAGEGFDIAWSPHDLPQGKILVRVDVVSDQGSYTAHAPAVLVTTSGQQCDEAPDPDAEATDERDNVDPVACREPDGPRCQCVSVDGGANGGPAWWALAVWLLRRRRGANPPLARSRARW